VNWPLPGAEVPPFVVTRTSTGPAGRAGELTVRVQSALASQTGTPRSALAT